MFSSNHFFIQVIPSCQTVATGGHVPALHHCGGEGVPAGALPQFCPCCRRTAWRVRETIGEKPTGHWLRKTIKGYTLTILKIDLLWSLELDCFWISKRYPTCRSLEENQVLKFLDFQLIFISRSRVLRCISSGTFLSELEEWPTQTIQYSKEIKWSEVSKTYIKTYKKHSYRTLVVTTGCKKMPRFLSDMMRFSLLVAALGHDIGHPGVNNGRLDTKRWPRSDERIRKSRDLMIFPFFFFSMIWL